MSSVSSVRPADRRATRPGVDPVRLTTMPVRVLRLIAVAVQIARLWLGARFLARRLSGERRAGFVARAARGLLDALAVDVVVRGRPPAGRKPVLLVANHVSWLDSYAIHTAADASFVAKSEVRGWPLIGTIAERFGTVFIVRGSRRGAWRTMKAAARILRAGRSVAVFPEGTTTDGTGMSRFYPALFQAAIDAGAAVQPVAVRYFGADGEPTRAAAFVGDMSIEDSLRSLVRERRLAVEVVFGPPIEAQRDRRALCQAAEDAVRQALALPKHWLVEVGAERKRPTFRPAGRSIAPAGA